MKKILILSFIYFLLLSGCIRKNENLHNNDKVTEATLNNIVNHIFIDLNLKSTYNTLDELISTFNLTEDLEITDEFGQPFSRNNQNFYIGNNMFFYVQFLSSDKYFINLLQINLNENNYLHLFPGKSFDEYKINIEFGDIIYIGEYWITYRLDQTIIYLYFKNDILDYITFSFSPTIL